MRITKVKTHRYSAAEIEKLDIALDLFSQSVNSVEFKHTIEQHEQFDTQEQYRNDEIYNIIMNGDEADTPEGIDHEADLNLTLDFRNSTDAIGYTKHERIFTFQNFFQQLQPTKLAGHYAHEYCHTLGFADPSDLSDLSKNVPYEVGRIIEEIAIRNHRIFIADEENLTDNERVAAMDTFRNATIVTGTEDETTAIRTAIPSLAKVRTQKPMTAKKAAIKKAVVIPKKKAVAVKKKKITKKTAKNK
jgi:hypothetical protein